MGGLGERGTAMVAWACPVCALRHGLRCVGTKRLKASSQLRAQEADPVVVQALALSRLVCGFADAAYVWIAEVVAVSCDPVIDTVNRLALDRHGMIADGPWREMATQLPIART